MRAAIIQSIQLISLAMAISYNAEAQVRTARPPRAPLPPVVNPHQELLSREVSNVIELGMNGLRTGQKQTIDLTREVLARRQERILSSLVILAASDKGRGQVDLYINGHIVLHQKIRVPMKRKAIQVDLNNLMSDVRSVVLETNGNVLVHSVTVNTSKQQLPALEETEGSIGDGGHIPVVKEVCEVEAQGVHGGRYVKYRIMLKGQSIDGSDSIDEVIHRLAQLEQAAVCRRAQAQCSIHGTGVVNGQYAKMIIKKNNVNFAGADDLNKLLETHQTLSEGHLCQMSVHRCELATAGVAGGQYFQHRLLVNGEAVLGANDLGTMLNQLNQLRRQNICQ